MRSLQLRRAPALFGSVVGVLLILATIAPAAAGGSGQLRGSFGGQAWALSANVHVGEASVQIGRAAFQPCPCRGTDNELVTNSIVSIDAGLVAQAAVTEATAQAGKFTDPKRARVQMTGGVADLSLLGGAITADAVRGVATTNAWSDRFSTSTAGSELLDLNILGIDIDPQVAPNTRINLPGLGHVTLRETKRLGNGTSYRGIEVTMLHVRITRENDLGLAVGADIKVGRAIAVYYRSDISVELGGAAFSGDADSSLVIRNRIGKAAPVYVGCRDMNGRIKRNSVLEIRAQGLLRTGTARSTATNDLTATSGWAKTTSVVESVKLLSGLIRADLVEVHSKSKWNHNTDSGSTNAKGTRLVNVTILGIPGVINTSPNSEIDLPGLGFVRFNEQIHQIEDGRARLTVIGIHVFVETPLNLLGLPVGTEIRVAVARSSAEA